MRGTCGRVQEPVASRRDDQRLIVVELALSSEGSRSPKATALRRGLCAPDVATCPTCALSTVTWVPYHTKLVFLPCYLTGVYLKVSNLRYTYVIGTLRKYTYFIAHPMNMTHSWPPQAQPEPSAAMLHILQVPYSQTFQSFRTVYFKWPRTFQSFRTLCFKYPRTFQSFGVVLSLLLIR